MCLDARKCYLSMLTVICQVEDKKKCRDFYFFPNKRQLSRARMNRRGPRMIGVDLSDITKNLIYENIIACKMITEDILEHQTPTCEAQ